MTVKDQEIEILSAVGLDITKQQNLVGFNGISAIFRGPQLYVSCLNCNFF
jgi:hypothetical protein